MFERAVHHIGVCGSLYGDMSGGGRGGVRPARGWEGSSIRQKKILLGELAFYGFFASMPQKG